MSSSVASHVVCDTGMASQRAPLSFGGKMDPTAYSRLVMSSPKSELCSLFTSWSTLMRVSRTGLIQHCLQRLLLWRHWSKSRRHQTALRCTARVSSLKQAQHECTCTGQRSCAKLHAVDQHYLSFCTCATKPLCYHFCAASNASPCAGCRNCYTGFAKACRQQSEALQSSTRHEEG
jgi:hypothetical protein